MTWMIWGIPIEGNPHTCWFFPPPNSVHTEGFLRWGCWIRVLNLASGFLPVNSRIKWLLYALVICPSALRLRRLAQNACCAFGLSHFTCKFLHKLAPVTCPCAFRLRWLTQNVRRMSGVRHFSWKFRIQWLWWHVHVHFECAGSHKM